MTLSGRISTKTSKSPIFQAIKVIFCLFRKFSFFVNFSLMAIFSLVSKITNVLWSQMTLSDIISTKNSKIPKSPARILTNTSYIISAQNLRKLSSLVSSMALATSESLNMWRRFLGGWTHTVAAPVGLTEVGGASSSEHFSHRFFGLKSVLGLAATGPTTSKSDDIE